MAVNARRERDDATFGIARLGAGDGAAVMVVAAALLEAELGQRVSAVSWVR